MTSRLLLHGKRFLFGVVFDILSLSYMIMSRCEKDLLLKKVKNKLALPMNFLVNSMSLYKAFGTADQWQKIYEVPLSG